MATTVRWDPPVALSADERRVVKVLKRIGAWGWGQGLRPSSSAPVWPMSAFRDRFLNAFDSPASR